MYESIEKLNTLSDKNRIIIGGIAGIAPLIISLLVVDLNSLVTDLARMDAVGLAVRCTVLFFIGTMWVIFIIMDRNPSCEA